MGKTFETKAVEECAAAAKNVFNDTEATSNFAKERLPAFIEELKAELDKVIADPNNYCAANPVKNPARLFAALPIIGQSQEGGIAVLGFGALAVTAGLVAVVRRRIQAAAPREV